MFSSLFSLTKRKRRTRKKKKKPSTNVLSKGTLSVKKKKKPKKKRLSIIKIPTKLPKIIRQRKYNKPILTIENKPMKRMSIRPHHRSRGFSMSNSSSMSNINGNRNIFRELNKQEMVDDVYKPTYHISQKNNIVQLPDGQLIQLPNEKLATKLYISHA